MVMKILANKTYLSQLAFTGTESTTIDGITTNEPKNASYDSFHAKREITSNIQGPDDFKILSCTKNPERKVYELKIQKLNRFPTVTITADVSKSNYFSVTKDHSPVEQRTVVWEMNKIKSDSSDVIDEVIKFLKKMASDKNPNIFRQIKQESIVHNII